MGGEGRKGGERLRLEELERQRAKGESVEAVGEEVVCVVEGLEEEVGGDQLAELVAAAGPRGAGGGGR